MRCRRCGHPVDLSGGRRVGFSEACPACGADWHCCLQCAHHDPSAYNECRESQAERVSDRERANRCEWFRPGSDSGSADDAARTRARADLDALFSKDKKR